MKRIYTIEIELDHASFKPSESFELQRILGVIDAKLDEAGVACDMVLNDSNGEPVGRARVAKRSK